VFGGVDDQRFVDGLSALRRPASARGNADTFIPCHGESGGHIVNGLRHNYANRLDLINGCIRRVAPAAERVKKHFALDRVAYFVGESRAHQRCFHGVKPNSARGESHSFASSDLTEL